MSNNTEFLKSLSDKQLADEIKYGRELAESGKHRDHTRRDLAEAIAEQQERLAKDSAQ